MRTIRSIGKLRNLACLALLLWESAAMAGIRAEPMAYDLTTSGSGARQDVRVENTAAQPSPVELRVERREILPDGSEKRTPADDDFLIFPPQGTIPSNGFQTFRIEYIGQPLNHTALYTITVAQLPVETEPERQTGVRFLFNLGTLTAVSPPGAKPELVIETVAPSPEPGKLRITVANQGNGYTRLRTGRWTLRSASGTTETLEGEELGKAISQPLIEPGTTRVIDLPVSPQFQREGATATYELPQAARP